MQDRTPTYPGRVTLTPVTGQDNTFDMAMADQPVAAGTPLNKASLLDDTVAAAVAAIEASTTPDTPNEALALLAAAFTGRAKIETGSYTGTGTYGTDNRNSLTFGFVPQLVIIIEDYYSSGTFQLHYGIFANGARSGIMAYTGGNGAALILSWSDSTMTWYNASSAANQLNASGRPYAYVAIG